MKEKKETDVFAKEQIINSSRYVDRKDLLNAILDKDKSYSLTEVDKMIENFMKGKVN